MKAKLKKYRKEFSESKMIQKLNEVSKYIGIKVAYPVLLLYYVYQKKETPAWAKRIVMGAIGYFIMPFDLVPDFLMPLIGYTDDLSVLTFGLLAMTAHIDTVVVEQSKDKLKTWFGEYDPSELEELDEKIRKKQESETIEVIEPEQE